MELNDPEKKNDPVKVIQEKVKVRHGTIHLEINPDLFLRYRLEWDLGTKFGA